MKRDIRGFLHFKDLFKFLKWFDEEKDREIHCMLREMKEELSEIGEENTFSSLEFPDFQLVRKVHDGPHQIQGYDYLQYSVFFVYEFADEYLERVNANEILVNASKTNEFLVMASREDIIRRRASDGLEIGTHGGLLFGTKRTGPYPTPYRPLK